MVTPHDSLTFKKKVFKPYKNNINTKSTSGIFNNLARF